MNRQLSEPQSPINTLCHVFMSSSFCTSSKCPSLFTTTRKGLHILSSRFVDVICRECPGYDFITSGTKAFTWFPTELMRVCGSVSRSCRVRSVRSAARSLAPCWSCCCSRISPSASGRLRPSSEPRASPRTRWPSWCRPLWPGRCWPPPTTCRRVRAGSEHQEEKRPHCLPVKGNVRDQ